ncbi:MAG: protein-export rane protein SecF [Clostridia bacterium]|jgi:preprotein translocase SecF subunit|nr:protein-export rane protein SecF [Clostridia bacterium]
MNFLKYRYFWIAISLIVIISGVGYGLVTGFKFDIDFMGGTKIQADLKAEFDNNEIENIVNDIIGTKPLVQKMSSGQSSVSITTDVISEEQSTKIVESLKEKFPNMDEPTTKNIQPSFGKNLIDSSILAIIVSMVFILLYVAIRFRTLGFVAALTALAALAHDVLVIIAFYGIFKLPINSTFVAVLLTIIGYSINDTIIVYDRIRENKRKITKSTDLADTINTSLNQTMTRTINTSLTVLVSIVVVLIYAQVYDQQVLKEFALPLTIGLVAGSYSSIFIASSLWYMFDGIKLKKSKAKAK